MKTTRTLLLLLTISLFLLACSTPSGPAAEIGDVVTIEYESRYANGSAFDSSKDYDVPVTFTIGNKEVFPGIERTVIGMHEGERKEILLSPEAAYGLPDSEKIELIPLEEFPNWSKVRIGMSLPAKDRSTGEEIEGKIINVTPEGIVVDFNHPLAGESLWMEITVKEIVKKKFSGIKNK